MVRRKTVTLISWGFALQSFPTSSQLDTADYFLLSSENTLYMLETSSHPYNLTLGRASASCLIEFLTMQKSMQISTGS